MKPYILITNDDGIFSPGILAVAQAVFDLGELLICAPICQQTSMARSFPRTKDLGIIEQIPLIIDGKHLTGYGVHGSPAYAVAHAVYELAERKPDLCISGINYGENLGLTLSCSGTVGAALEADSHDIPAIAVSRQANLSIQRSNQYKILDWEASKQITRIITKKILKEGMPKGVSFFNINVPEGIEAGKDFCYTKQSRQNYFLFQKPDKRDFTQPFQLASQRYVDENQLEKESDIQVFYVERKISVTPITWDMTSYGFLNGTKFIK